MIDKIKKVKLEPYSSFEGAYTLTAPKRSGTTDGAGLAVDLNALKHYESPLATAVKKGEPIMTPMISSGIKIRYDNGSTAEPAIGFGPHASWNSGFSFSGTTNATNTLYTSINGAVVSQWMAAQLQFVSGSAAVPAISGISEPLTGLFWGSGPSSINTTVSGTIVSKWVSNQFRTEGGSDSTPGISSLNEIGTGLYWGSTFLAVTVATVNTARWVDTAYRQPALAAPGTPATGDQWNDSTQKCFVEYPNGINQHRVGGLFTQTANKTIADTVTETTLFGTGVGTLTLPVVFFVAGKTIRVTIRGFYSEGTASNGTFNVKLGSVSICTTGAFAIAGAATNVGWVASVDITCRSTGASGTVHGQGMYLYSTNGQQPIQNTAVATVDTTGTLTLDVMWTWSVNNANNTITSTNATVEVLL